MFAGRKLWNEKNREREFGGKKSCHSSDKIPFVFSSFYSFPFSQFSETTKRRDYGEGHQAERKKTFRILSSNEQAENSAGSFTILSIRTECMHAYDRI